MIDHGEVKARALKNPQVRDSYVEAFVRRKTAAKVQKWCDDNGLDREAFAMVSGLSRTQRRRLLNVERGGELYMSTIVTAARLMKITVAELVECGNPPIDEG